jgi:hypothetical protein
MLDRKKLAVLVPKVVALVVAKGVVVVVVDLSLNAALGIIVKLVMV